MKLYNKKHYFLLGVSKENLEMIYMSKLNILFLMTDQHNPDYVGYSGKGKANTPNIDWIAQGTYFINAISPNPVCTPTRCALLTGKYPHQIGMMTTSGDLSTQHPTFIRALKNAGYFTAGIGKFHFLQGWHWDTKRGQGHNLVALKDQIKKFGFDYIWEAAGKGLSLKNYCDYCEYLNELGLLEIYRDEIQRREVIGHPEYPNTSESFGIPYKHHVDVVIADQIIRVLREKPNGKPFCIFGSFVSPHPIIDPPEKYYAKSWEDRNEGFLIREGQNPMPEDKQERWIKNRRGYRALVHLVDDQIGRILKALDDIGELENTLIIFTSDHGDMLGNFGVDGKDRPWRESSSVPLAIRHPDFVLNRKITSPVSLIDITATILEAARLEPKKELSLSWPAWHHVVPCRSLMPVISGDKEQIREFTFTENDGWEMIQTEKYKYIRYRTVSDEYIPPREELYDLENDPNEIKDVARYPGYGEILQWYRERRDFIINSTPAAQIRWAPVMNEEHST
jgi:arylsulfatase